MKEQVFGRIIPASALAADSIEVTLPVKRVRGGFKNPPCFGGLSKNRASRLRP